MAADVARISGEFTEHSRHVDKNISDLWIAVDKVNARLNTILMALVALLGSVIGVLVMQVIIYSKHG
jgi:hypothetical protein